MALADPLAAEKSRYEAWATSDPVGWMDKVLGQRLNDRQEEMALAVRDHPRVAVKSCHASGKTHLAGRLALHWVCSVAGSLAILTGPTFRQVQENAWQELVGAYQAARYPIGGRLLDGTARFRLGPRWGVLGFATDNPINFSGFHAARVLVIVDEASGVEEGLYESLEGLLSSGTVRLLLLSQGTQTAGTFYDAFHTHRRFWKTITISAFDTPNFQPDVLREWLGRDPGFAAGMTDEQKAAALQEAWREVQPREDHPWPHVYLVNPAWACQLAEKNGLDSDPYRVRVLGGFVKGDPYSLIQLHWFERARLNAVAPSREAKTWMGVDVARYGDDDSVFVIRRGPVVLHYEEVHGQDTVQVAGRAAQLARQFGVTDCNVDVVGVGAGVADNLKHQTSATVHEINAGAGARDSEQFLNVRAEMSWGTRERFEKTDISLAAVPNDALERMAGELTGIRWFTTPAGKIQIESKADFKKRLGRSPDAADGLILSFAVPTDELAVIWMGEDDDPFDDW